MSILGVKTFMSFSYVHEIRNHVHIIGLQNRCKKQLFLWKIGGLRTLASLVMLVFGGLYIEWASRQLPAPRFAAAVGSRGTESCNAIAWATKTAFEGCRWLVKGQDWIISLGFQPPLKQWVEKYNHHCWTLRVLIIQIESTIILMVVEA